MRHFLSEKYMRDNNSSTESSAQTGGFMVSRILRVPNN